MISGWAKRLADWEFFNDKRAIPIKQNGKVKWLYVSLEHYNQIVKTSKLYPNQKYD